MGPTNLGSFAASSAASNQVLAICVPSRCGQSEPNRGIPLHSRDIREQTRHGAPTYRCFIDPRWMLWLLVSSSEDSATENHSFASYGHPPCDLLRQPDYEWGGVEFKGSRRRLHLTHLLWQLLPRLLCARREGPRKRCAAKKRDEITPPHSITSSARAICLQK